MASINSALQRARETLSKRYPQGRPAAARPDAGQQKLVERYVTAWEAHDLDGFVALLKEDATFTMPPWTQWYAGREAIRAFFARMWAHCGGLRLVPVAANGQPALAVYERDSEGRFVAHAIHVLTFDEAGIGGVTAFLPPSGPRLFAAFGLPAALAGS